MQLLFYEGDEHSDDGPCLCYSKRDSRAKNKAIVPFLLWTMPSRIVCKTGLSSPITNLSNGNLECTQIQDVPTSLLRGLQFQNSGKLGELTKAVGKLHLTSLCFGILLSFPTILPKTCWNTLQT